MEKPSYQEGLKLLKKYKPKLPIIMMLNFGISKNNWNLLISELQILDEEIEAKKKAKDIDYTIKSDEDGYKLIKNINKNEFSRTYNIFLVQLKSPNKNIRYKAAAHILNSFEKVIVPTQKDLKYYEENGKLPEKHYLTSQIPDKKVDVTQRKLNLRSYISKNKNRPEKAAEVQRKKIELQQVIEAENALRNQ